MYFLTKKSVMWKTVLVVLCLCYSTESATFLGIFPTSIGSNYVLSLKLMKALTDAGHDVTFVSPFKQKSPLNTKGRFSNLILEGVAKPIQQKMAEVFEINLIQYTDSVKTIKYMQKAYIEGINETMHHPKIKMLLNSYLKYDAVIIEDLHNDALKVFATIFKCPLIVLASTGSNHFINPVVGTPNEISYIRHIVLGGNPYEPMALWERTFNVFLNMLDYFMLFHSYLPQHQNILKRTIKNPPQILDLYNNVSLVLLNTHTSIHPPQPLVPSMVEIGGFHINPPNKLSPDLQKFLDDAKDGAIYFSMGFILRSVNMPDDRKQLFLDVLGKLKERVIWKFEGDLPEKSSNMLVRKWFPQPDILAHPNIKLFITQGGLLSITEAICFGVPILAIPMPGEQIINAERAKHAGYGLMLEYHDRDFSEERLSYLINELLFDSKYRENAKRISKLFHDRPMNPKDAAVYWMEYVVRNKGARHLRGVGINQTWYEYYLVDVAFIGLVAVCLTLYIHVYLGRKLLCPGGIKKPTTVPFRRPASPAPDRTPTSPAPVRRPTTPPPPKKPTSPPQKQTSEKKKRKKKRN